MPGGFSMEALLPQLVIGLYNGARYALLSLGLAVIFGLLKSSTSRTARCTRSARSSRGGCCTAWGSATGPR
jgi:hypothetical protein